METRHLTDLPDVETLQRFQDSFSDMTKIAAADADANGIPVTEPTCFPPLLHGYHPASPQGQKTL